MAITNHILQVVLPYCYPHRRMWRGVEGEGSLPPGLRKFYVKAVF